jgi:hypothetical protein
MSCTGSIVLAVLQEGNEWKRRMAVAVSQWSNVGGAVGQLSNKTAEQ